MTQPTRLEDRVAALEDTVGTDPDGVTIRERVVWLQQVVSDSIRLEIGIDRLSDSTRDLTTVLIQVDENAAALRKIDAKQDAAALDLQHTKEQIVPRAVLEGQRRTDRFVLALAGLLVLTVALVVGGFVLSNRRTVSRINEQRRGSLATAYVNCYNANSQLQNERTLFGQIQQVPTLSGLDSYLRGYVAKIPPDADCTIYATQLTQLHAAVPAIPTP